MRGESHLIASFMISLPTITALYTMASNTLPEVIAYVLGGVLLGCLLPDVDASDAKVMHGYWRPIGLFGNYVLYKPMTWILRTRSDAYREQHRGYSSGKIGGWIVDHQPQKNETRPLDRTSQRPRRAVGLVIHKERCLYLPPPVFSGIFGSLLSYGCAKLSRKCRPISPAGSEPLAGGRPAGRRKIYYRDRTEYLDPGRVLVLPGCAERACNT